MMRDVASTAVTLAGGTRPEVAVYVLLIIALGLLML